MLAEAVERFKTWPPITEEDKAKHAEYILLGVGPWLYEPTHLSFVAHGLPCFTRRNSVTKVLCGYVATPTHLPEALTDRMLVHGGVSYSSPVKGQPFFSDALIHLGVFEDVYRWHVIGFDCAHFGDTVPSLPATSAIHHGVYRGIGYVREQTEKLALQVRTVLTRNSIELGWSQN